MSAPSSCYPAFITIPVLPSLALLAAELSCPGLGGARHLRKGTEAAAGKGLLTLLPYFRIV